MQNNNTWAYSSFDFNSTIRIKKHLAVQLFGNKVIERFSLTNHTEHPDSLTQLLIYSTLFLDNIEN